MKRKFNQLAQLRNLGLKLKTAMDSIAQFFSEERDVLYLRGQEKEQIKVVTNLLTTTEFSLEQIADLVGVSVEFVEGIKQKLAAKK